MAAAEAKDLLMLKKGSIKAKEASEFIASHRDESNYHMFLKFLAGMVSSLKGGYEIAIVRFWEAVSCDLHETISTGVSGLVELWMYLLPQSILKDGFDKIIPNLDKIVEIIDKIVISNFVQWEKVIENSGYLSEGILLFIEREIISGRRVNSPSSDLVSIDSIDIFEDREINPVLQAVIEVTASISNEALSIKMFHLLLGNLSTLEDRNIIESSIIAMIKLLTKNKIPSSEIEIFKAGLELYLHDNRLFRLAGKALEIIDQYAQGIVIMNLYLR